MAMISPTSLSDLRADPTGATWIHPHTGDFSNAGTLTPGEFLGCEHLMFYFDSIANADVWVSGIPGIKHVATFALAGSNVRAFLTDIATGQLQFTASASGQKAIVHLWRR